MSVLVRGMEMPANSRSCSFTEMGDDFEKHCLVGGKYEWHKDRLCDGCPLIHIPPHGNLVDVDEVLKVGLRDANIIIPRNEGFA